MITEADVCSHQAEYEVVVVSDTLARKLARQQQNETDYANWSSSAREAHVIHQFCLDRARSGAEGEPDQVEGFPSPGAFSGWRGSGRSIARRTPPPHGAPG